MTLRSNFGALALPFLIGAISLRLAVAPVGDAIARAVAAVAPTPRPAAKPAEPPPLDERDGERSRRATSDGDVDGDEQPMTPGPRRVASRATTTRHREADAGAAAAGTGAAGTGAAGGADGGRAPSLTDPPKATIVVPAALVAKALERRDVGATNATAPDGSPLGARLAGVSKYRAGLRDGDVVVAIGGTRTPTVEAMVGAAMAAASSGAGRISGRIVRGDATFAVVLELPK
jgi:hypothetical protein